MLSNVIAMPAPTQPAIWMPKAAGAATDESPEAAAVAVVTVAVGMVAKSVSVVGRGVGLVLLVLFGAPGL